jgi:hypothetical protein
VSHPNRVAFPAEAVDQDPDPLRHVEVRAGRMIGHLAAVRRGVPGRHELDFGAGGGGDEGLFTYDPGKRQWTFVVLESERRPTLFVSDDTRGARITYHSVYPDASMTETIERISPAKYTIHFTQTAAGKTTKSVDVCTKR